MFIQGMLHWAIFRATCIATKLLDKLQNKLPSVTAPLCMPCKDKLSTSAQAGRMLLMLRNIARAVINFSQFTKSAE